MRNSSSPSFVFEFIQEYSMNIFVQFFKEKCNFQVLFHNINIQSSSNDPLTGQSIAFLNLETPMFSYDFNNQGAFLLINCLNNLMCGIYSPYC